MKNYYEILGVPAGAPTKKCFEAYKREIAKVHPEFEGQDSFIGYDQQRCLELNEAVMTIGNQENIVGRDAYNDKLKEHVNATKPKTTKVVPAVQSLNQSWFKKNKNAIIAAGLATVVTIGAMSWFNKKNDTTNVPVNEPTIETPAEEKPVVEDVIVEDKKITEADFGQLCVEFENQAKNVGLSLKPNEVAAGVYIANISHFEQSEMESIFANYFNGQTIIDQIALEGVVALLKISTHATEAGVQLDVLSNKEDAKIFDSLQKDAIETINLVNNPSVDQITKDAKLTALLAQATKILETKTMTVAGENVELINYGFGARTLIRVYGGVIGDFANKNMNNVHLDENLDTIIATSSGTVQEIANTITNEVNNGVDPVVAIDKVIKDFEANKGNYLLTEEDIVSLEKMISLYDFYPYVERIQAADDKFMFSLFAPSNEYNKNGELVPGLMEIHESNISTENIGSKTN